MLLSADVIAIVVAVAFLLAGAAKVLHARPLVADFARFGYPGWSCPTTGLVELTGAALLVIGVVVGPLAAVAGAVILFVVMIGAVATHVRMHDHAAKVGPPVVLLALLGAELLLRAGS